MKAVLFLVLVLFMCFVQLDAQVPGDFDYTFHHLDSAKANPEWVYRLDLSKQKLREIPPAVFNFPNLEYLNLSKNRISLIPSQISKLGELKQLDLSKNQISILPPKLGMLLSLEKLLLSKNTIESIPDEIGRLQQLEHLDLWQNELRQFSDSLGNCASLRILDLRGMIISDADQLRLAKLLPETTIHFSNACDCKN